MLYNTLNLLQACICIACLRWGLENSKWPVHSNEENKLNLNLNGLFNVGDVHEFRTGKGNPSFGLPGSQQSAILSHDARGTVNLMLSAPMIQFSPLLWYKIKMRCLCGNRCAINSLFNKWFIALTHKRINKALCCALKQDLWKRTVYSLIQS